VRINKTTTSATDILWEEMLPTPLGPLWLAFTAKGLRWVHFQSPMPPIGPVWPVDGRESGLTDQLRRWRQEAGAALDRYFSGQPETFSHLTLDLQGTPFQLQVWEALRQIAFGSVTTYQALAQAVGRPRGARAVGAALRANPLPIILPCHRVVGSHGDLGGYSAGQHVKRELLSLERQATGQSPMPWQGPMPRS